jgi:hypothetical protein
MVRGRKVRRENWRRWIFYTPYYLWFSHIPATTGEEPTPEECHVVRNSEYTATEFLAVDWTDEPWDSDGVPPRPCAAGFVWSLRFNACVPLGSIETGGGGAGSPPGPGAPPSDPGDELPDGAGHWWEPGNPAGSGGGGGGSGGGGGGGPVLIVPPAGGIPTGTGSNAPPDPPPHDPPAAAEPRITANVYIDQPGCYSLPLPEFVRVLVEVSVQGGPAGVGGMSIDAGVGPQTSTGWPGMVMTYEFLVPPGPGGTLEITVTYHAPPQPGGLDYTETFEVPFSPWCYGYP